MHKNTCSVLRYIKEGILFFILVLMISCQNDFDNNNNNKEKETLNLHNNYEIVNGTIKIESKEKLKNILSSYQNDVEIQNNFNDEIRTIQDKGFKPLTPIFDEDDNQKLEAFIVGGFKL